MVLDIGVVLKGRTHQRPPPKYYSSKRGNKPSPPSIRIQNTKTKRYLANTDYSTAETTKYRATKTLHRIFYSLYYKISTTMEKFYTHSDITFLIISAWSPILALSSYIALKFLNKLSLSVICV